MISLGLYPPVLNLKFHARLGVDSELPNSDPSPSVIRRSSEPVLASKRK